ncbi:MAG TPA: putative Ig domain-containing protein, partial [Pirellulales bacterium]|nr:putative Ig domain-containing protein [Pirellulales bacterium]
NADGSFTYTPAPGFTGTDTFRYQDFDGLSYSSTVPVTIDVQHAINLFPPDDQANNESDAVNLQFPATDANGLAIKWQAAGLPAGVSIDPNTGLIAGNLPYTAAETNRGKYPVTLTVTDGQDTVTANFTWYVSNTNRLTQPDDQVTEPGGIVALQLQAVGGPFIFGAVGLPAGLNINSSTGLISGTITENPVKPRTHTVTVSVNGGGFTDTQTFNWTVVSSSQPYVEIAIEDTVSTDDDFTANLQPIPARVTLYDLVAGEHDVQIVVPSGLSTISGGNLVLTDGQSAEITIVPLQYSQKENDVVLLAQVDGKKAGVAKETNAKITITPVRNPDTPKGMPDRIPPREFTRIDVTVTPTMKGKKLTAEVIGQSDARGRTEFKAPGVSPQSNLEKRSVRVSIACTEVPP